jgi:hypothetical protein
MKWYFVYCDDFDEFELEWYFVDFVVRCIGTLLILDVMVLYCDMYWYFVDCSDDNIEF